MADKLITVRENSRPFLTFEMVDFRNEVDPTLAVDITGWAFRLVVKNDIDDPDAQALVDLAGVIVSAPAGTFSFTLTTAHTSLAPGTYVGEIRWWEDGVTTNPPHDAWRVSYTVQKAVDNTV